MLIWLVSVGEYRDLFGSWSAGRTHIRDMRGVAVQDTDRYGYQTAVPVILWSTTGIYLQAEDGIIATHDSRIHCYHPTLIPYQPRVDPISYCCRSMMRSTIAANVPNAFPYRNFQSLS